MTDSDTRTVDRDVAEGIDARSLSAAPAAAGDSFTVAGWTVVSRASGLIRIATVGAVLGPTLFGNAYQFTNSLPNLVFYGLLAGSLYSSLLVPALVRHLDAGDRPAAERVAGGFLGVAVLGLAIVVPLVIAVAPLLLRATAMAGQGEAAGLAQERLARWLVLMLVPQAFLYAVIGASTAIMNTCRRFALAAAAPALENVATLVVLGTVAAFYGTGSDLESVTAGQVVLLGVGTTAAVAVHAATQWWGARRAGVTLVPRRGWRDGEVVPILRRAVPALVQAGLLTLQTVTLLSIANRVGGGVVAAQIALQFSYLPIALAAAPVALSLLPRLARLHRYDEVAVFRDTLTRGLTFALFVTIPAAVGYLLLAGPIARAVSFGPMGSGRGVALVAAAVAALAGGLVGETVFLIATYASYARNDTRSPLAAMGLGTVAALVLMGVAFVVDGAAVLAVLGLAFSAGKLVAAGHLLVRLDRRLPRGDERLARPVLRTAASAAIMGAPAWLVATQLDEHVAGWLGGVVATIAGSLLGLAVYLGLQALWRAPELSWAAGGVGHLRAKLAGRSG